MRALCAVLIWLVTGLPVTAGDGVLNVAIAYRERIALPPDAVAQVVLLDTSRQDAPAVRLSSQRFAMTGVPMAVELHYDPALIDDAHSYSVSAEILSGDTTLFRTTSNNPVITQGAPGSVALTLTQVSASDTGSGSQPRITGLAWAAYEIGGRAIAPEDPPTLTLDGQGRFGLFSGCNRFTGTATIGDGTIAFPENFAGTLMACPENREQLQQQTLDAVRAATAFVRDGDLLALTDASGTATIRFRAQPE
ncbi:MAG: YbaY family lipoprotein [Pseudomonadota bacterium]